MGAFLLYRNGALKEAADVERCFRVKGFLKPMQFQLKDWNLWLYEKQLVQVQNYCSDTDGCSIFAVGTPIYKGKSYGETLKALLHDYRMKTLDQSQLVGSFCLLFWDGMNLTGLTDRQNTLHVFYNRQRTCLSSSFLAMVAASSIRLTIDRMAVCERLSAGYITSPDTLIEEIKCHDDDDSWNLSRDGFSWLSHPVSSENQLSFKNRKDCLRRQVDALQNHFSRLDAISREYGGELGLSDGLDSRLLLACGRFLSTPLAIHTHATAGAHDATQKIVHAIAHGQGFSVTEVPTRRMLDHSPEKVAEILLGNLYFCDGRNGDTLGAFNETYTAQYQSKVCEGKLFGLNGIGGEIYRNYRSASSWSIDLNKWMQIEVFARFARETIANGELFAEMGRRVREKIVRRIGDPPQKDKADLRWQRKYFVWIRMPDSRAIVNDACNQLQFYHTPFLDSDIVETALSIDSYLGNHCEFEMDMLALISPELMSYDSSYGFPFDHCPISCRISSWLKSHFSNYGRHLWQNWKVRKSVGQVIHKYREFCKRTPCMSADRELLLDAHLIADFDLAMTDDCQRPSVVMIAEFLREFSDKIRI